MSECATAMIARCFPRRAARRWESAERDVPLVRTVAWASCVSTARKERLPFRVLPERWVAYRYSGIVNLFAILPNL